MQEVIFGAPVIETGVAYCGSMIVVLLAMVLGIGVCIGLAALGAYIFDWTGYLSVAYTVLAIGTAINIACTGYGLVLTKGTAEVQDTLKSMPSFLVETKEKYVIDMGSCTDILGVSEQYRIEEYEGSLEGSQLVWLIPIKSVNVAVH